MACNTFEIAGECETDWNRAACVCEPERPTWTKTCQCGRTVERWRGQGDVSCQCGASYNAGGQRLRDDWRGNPSWYDDEIGDLEGYEMQQVADEVFNSREYVDSIYED